MTDFYTESSGFNIAVSINGTPVFTVTSTGTITNTAVNTFSAATKFTGAVSVDTTLGFAAAWVCALTVPVTVSGVQGAGTLTITHRLRIQSAGNTYYMLGTTSAQ